MRRPAIATLALFLLALLFGWETREALRATPGGQDNAATPASWQPGGAAPDPQPPPDPTPAAAIVTARPLFRPDRQPFREQAASAARNYESELSRFTLLGVFGFGEEPVGVVVGKTGNRTDRWEVKAGDALPGFTVKEIGVEGLALTADGREFLLPLYAGPPTAASGALRTETPRRDATPPGGAPGSVVPPKPAAPPAAAAPAPMPGPAAPAPFRPRPAVPPRYTPGRR